MPRGPAPAWKACAPHTLEAIPYVEAALKIGYDRDLLWDEITSHERALQMKKGLHNAAFLRKVSLSCEVESSGEHWRIRFRIHDKKQARAYMIAKYGPDPKKWPYFSRTKGR